VDPIAEKISANFKELAMCLYHAMGCAIWHKVLFLNDTCHRMVTESLVAHAHCLENRQLRVVLKYVVQRYVLNIPHNCFDVGFAFIQGFMQHIRVRQDWMNETGGSSIAHQSADAEFRNIEKSSDVISCFQTEQMFNTYIYRKSGISSFFYQNLFSAEQIEEARSAIIIGVYIFVFIHT
jgi:hypothetical protein